MCIFRGFYGVQGSYVGMRQVSMVLVLRRKIALSRIVERTFVCYYGL